MTRWNPEALDRMAKMYRGGETLAVIAAAFDVSRGVIAGLVSRNPDRFPKGAVPRKPGPPKKPASETAKAAKAGKTAKNGKAGRGRIKAPTHQQPAYPTAEEEALAAARRIEERRRAAIRAYDTRHMQLAGSEPVPFIDCGEFQCHLIITAGEDALGPDAPCCGRPVAEGSAYCPQHLKLMYRAPGRAT